MTSKTRIKILLCIPLLAGIAYCTYMGIETAQPQVFACTNTAHSDQLKNSPPLEEVEPSNCPSDN